MNLKPVDLFCLYLCGQTGALSESREHGMDYNVEDQTGLKGHVHLQFFKSLVAPEGPIQEE